MSEGSFARFLWSEGYRLPSCIKGLYQARKNNSLSREELLDLMLGQLKEKGIVKSYELKDILADYQELAKKLESRNCSFNREKPEGPALDPSSGLVLHALAYLAPERPFFCEVGTSRGRSTMILAYHAKKKGGNVVTFEKNERSQRQAKWNLHGAGLDQCVSFVLGDAVEEIAKRDEEFGKRGIDLLLHDERKADYYLTHFLLDNHLKSGAVVVADNMYWPWVAGVRDYLRFVPKEQSTVLRVGKGLSVYKATDKT